MKYKTKKLKIILKNGKLHQLSLGIKKPIKKNIFLNYTITQQIPQIKKEVSKKITAKKIKGNAKGGTWYAISLEYDF